MGDVLDDVLGDLGLVGATHQGVELGADLVLAGGRHFVVMHFNRHAAGLEGQTHGGTHVVEGIDRRNREVATLDGRTVAGVAAFELLVGGPGAFFGEDLVVGAGHVHLPLDGVEDEEFGLGAEEGGVADAGGLQVGLGAVGDGTRVTVVALAVGRVDHVAGQDQGGLVEERVDVGGVGVRHQQHVGGLDTLPASNGGAVEGMTAFELVFVKRRDRHADVVFLALGVGKTEVDELDFVFLDDLHDVLRGHITHS